MGFDRAERFVRLAKFAELTGYTPAAIRTKIYRGLWREGEQYCRAPDGRILIDMEAYDKWVQSAKEKPPDPPQ